MGKRRWQDRANLILGLWVFVSPRVLDYTGQTAAAWNAYVIGAGIVVFALIAARIPKAREEIINMVLGVWLVVSPFVLGYSAMTEIALHSVLVGILATAFAIWAMSNDQRFYKRWRSRSV